MRFFAICTVILFQQFAHGVCASPAAAAGAREYFSSSKNYKMCDGTNWNEFMTANSLTACAGLVGRMDYDVAQTSYKVCDNANYIKITPACTPTALTYKSKIVDATNMAGPNKIRISNNAQKAFVGTKWGQRIAVLDISGSPAAPTLLGVSAASTHLTDSEAMALYGNYLFVTGVGPGPSTGKLVAYDVSTNTPTLAGTVSASPANEMDHIFGVDLSSNGKYAFTVSWGSGSPVKCWMHAINISNPAAMTIAGKLDVTTTGSTSTYCNNIKVRGNTAYLAADDGGAVITVDITDPTLMSVKGTLTNANLTNSQGFDLSTDGNYFFGAIYGAANRFNVVNVSNPSAPAYTTSITNAGFNGSYITRVINSSYALVAGGTSDAVVLVNIATPGTPSVVQSFTSAGNLDTPTDMRIQGRYAYVTNIALNSVTVLDLGCDPKPVVTQGACSTAGTLDYFSATKALAYCNGSAFTVIAQADVTPGPVDWADFKDTSVMHSIFEIGSTVDLQLSYTNSSGTPTVQYRKNGGSWTTFTTGTPAQVSMTNADSLEFQVSGTTNHAATITVTNLSDNGAVLDTMVGTVDYNYFFYVPSNSGNTIYVFKIAKDGSLSQITGSPFAGPTGPYSVTVDPQSKFLYVTAYGTARVHGFAINQTTGAVGAAVTGSPFTTGNGPTQVHVTPDGKFAYTGNYTGNSISGFTVNTTTGALTAIAGSPWAVATGVVADVQADPASKFLYAVCDANTNNLFGYSINSTTGALTILATFPKTPGRTPQTVVFDGTGAFLYTANWGDNNIGGYSFNSTTGALTLISGSPWATGTRPNSVVTDLAGKMLFSGNSTANTLTTFKITAGTGALTSITGGSFATGANPWDVQLDPTGKFVYSINNTTGNITAVRFNAASSAALLITGSPFAATGAPQSGGFAKIARP